MSEIFILDILIHFCVQVVEAPRPVAAWDLVLEEMKWMAADFKQERIWKKSAARVSAAAVKEAVADRNARKASEAALLENSLAQRTVARSLAEQVSHFWGNVARLYEYELARKSTIFNTRLISCQLNHVSEIQEWDNNQFLISTLLFIFAKCKFSACNLISNFPIPT